MANWGLETKWALSTTSHPLHPPLHLRPRVRLRLEEFDFKPKLQNCRCLEIRGWHILMSYFLIFSVRFYQEMPRLPMLLQHPRYPEYVTLLRNIQWCVSYIPSIFIEAVIVGLSNISSSKLNMHSIFIGYGNLRVFRIMLSSIPKKTCEYPHSIKIEGIEVVDDHISLNTRTL